VWTALRDAGVISADDDGYDPEHVEEHLEVVQKGLARLTPQSIGVSALRFQRLVYRIRDAVNAE